MKRYFVFAGDDYYPIGGMSDFRGHFDTVEEAGQCCVSNWSKYGWAQFLDTEIGAVVDYFGPGEGFQPARHNPDMAQRLNVSVAASDPSSPNVSE